MLHLISMCSIFLAQIGPNRPDVIWGHIFFMLTSVANIVSNFYIANYTESQYYYILCLWWLTSIHSVFWGLDASKTAVGSQ